ncbi:hypothetical protein QOZ83_16515 [Romboutsia sedimentorum]|uniref:hypothetical protein n=1 Tax=Romboutsia sedimentorum TaxID=1368474 RepID=UPI0024DEE550|nr:hypothetical protein [Romboutsia sedimentorum]MDK2587445.1 hypothetical protein [Romboutsia sedimentorum]
MDGASNKSYVWRSSRRYIPLFLTKKREDDILSNALWTQYTILVVSIAIPLLGLGSIDTFFKMLTDLSSLAVVITCSYI